MSVQIVMSDLHGIAHWSAIWQPVRMGREPRRDGRNYMNARYSLSSIRAIKFSLKGFGKLFNEAALRLVSVFKIKVPVHTKCSTFGVKKGWPNCFGSSQTCTLYICTVKGIIGAPLYLFISYMSLCISMLNMVGMTRHRILSNNVFQVWTIKIHVHENKQECGTGKTFMDIWKIRLRWRGVVIFFYKFENLSVIC